MVKRLTTPRTRLSDAVACTRKQRLNTRRDKLFTVRTREHRGRNYDVITVMIQPWATVGMADCLTPSYTWQVSISRMHIARGQRSQYLSKPTNHANHQCLRLWVGRDASKQWMSAALLQSESYICLRLNRFLTDVIIYHTLFHHCHHTGF